MVTAGLAESREHAPDGPRLVTGFRCWVCGAGRLELAKRSNAGPASNDQSFLITDKEFGVTAEIHRCLECGFLQCSGLTDVLPLYRRLHDEAYQAGRGPRARQARRLLRLVQGYRGHGRLLDIGAGAGVLVEQALSMGYRAEGIEPSEWLQQQASAHGLPVHLGTFPHPDVAGPFDVVTLIDVLEHVPDPVRLLRGISDVLRADGIAVVVTPDTASVAARLLGRRWWHYRLQHIGYFKPSSLLLALDRAGLEAISIRRPRWYFPVSYLLERVNVYLPGRLRLPIPPFSGKLVVPLNLRDSMLAVVKAKASRPESRDALGLDR